MEEQVRREEAERVGPPAEKPKKGIDRVCLRCQQPFRAETRYLRLCEGCRKHNGIMYHPQYEGW